MSSELKDCPMCGCAATFVKHSAGMPGTQGFDKWDAVACKHCRTTVGACDRRFRNREDAAEAWNRRIPSPPLRDVLAERKRQDAQWGGPEHDDTHDKGDWLECLQYQINCAYRGPDTEEGATDPEVRERFIKIAALAIAATESMDRRGEGNV